MHINQVIKRNHVEDDDVDDLQNYENFFGFSMSSLLPNLATSSLFTSSAIAKSVQRSIQPLPSGTTSQGRSSGGRRPTSSSNHSNNNSNNNNNNNHTDSLEEIELYQDGLEDMEALSVIRFPEDHRIREVCRMLRSSKPSYLKVDRSAEISDVDFRLKLQEKLNSLLRR
jgi:hypothetical protein